MRRREKEKKTEHGTVAAKLQFALYEFQIAFQLREEKKTHARATRRLHETTTEKKSTENDYSISVGIMFNNFFVFVLF